LQHLGEGVTVPAEFSEMICGPCVAKNPFLALYKADNAEVVEDCPLKGKDNLSAKEEALFWSDGWRSKLCQCDDCKAKYKQQKVEFLCNDADMVQEYEKQGLGQLTQYEQGLQALSTMDRTKQIDVITGMKFFISSYSIIHHTILKTIKIFDLNKSKIQFN